MTYPQDHQADDLRAIRGIGRKVEKALYDAGIYHYWQIADWSESDLDWAKDIVPRLARDWVTTCWIIDAQILDGQTPEHPEGCDLGHLDSIAPRN